MVASCVHGFHVYQDIWTPATGERLSCQTEDSNAIDPYAVAVKKGVNIIGHVPRKISAACYSVVALLPVSSWIPAVNTLQICHKAVWRYPASWSLKLAIQT